MIFGHTHKDLGPFGAILFTGLGKTAWSLGIAWMIIACSTGHGGKQKILITIIYQMDVDSETLQ